MGRAIWVAMCLAALGCSSTVDVTAGHDAGQPDAAAPLHIGDECPSANMLCHEAYDAAQAIADDAGIPAPQAGCLTLTAASGGDDTFCTFQCETTPALKACKALGKTCGWYSRPNDGGVTLAWCR